MPTVEFELNGLRQKAVINDYINEDVKYFDGFDFENAKPIKHSLITKLQATDKESMVFDSVAR